jgi:hypothetical protein
MLSVGTSLIAMKAFISCHMHHDHGTCIGFASARLVSARRDQYLPMPVFLQNEFAPRGDLGPKCEL